MKGDMVYLPRTIFPGVLGIFLTEESFKKEMTRLKIPNVKFLKDHANASARWLEYSNARGRDIFIFTMDGRQAKKYSRSSLAALVAHEAVHLADYMFECAGEDKPGAETKAYLIQYLVCGILDAIDKWKPGK